MGNLSINLSILKLLKFAKAKLSLHNPHFPFLRIPKRPVHMLTGCMRDEQVLREGIRLGGTDAHGAHPHREPCSALLPPLLDALVQPGNGTGGCSQGTCCPAATAAATARAAHLAQHRLGLSGAWISHG